MNTQRKKLIVRNQKIVVGFIIICLTTTVLFFRYEGEKLVDMAMPQQQVTYYKISELTQEDHTALPQTIKVYREQNVVAIVQAPNSECEYQEKDIKIYK